MADEFNTSEINEGSGLAKGQEFGEKAAQLVRVSPGGFNISANTLLNLRKPSNLAIQGGVITRVRGVLFKAPTDDETIKTKSEEFSVEQRLEQEFERISLFGTPVISNLEIKAGSFRNLDGDIITYEGLRIDNVIFNISQTKNVVLTPVVGRPGTVKEYISDGDFSITAEIIIIGETKEKSPDVLEIEDIGNRIPERDITRLLKILQVPEQIDVRSDFLDFFEISKVVVMNYSSPQRPGHTNSQVFSINFVSDEPIELQ